MGIFSRFKKVKELSESQSSIADAAFERGDYKTAFDMYQQAADLGENERAAFHLGIMYATGKGVEHDYLLAGRWFRKAYTLGNADASKYFVKVLMDYAGELLDTKVYGRELFAKFSEYVELVWPDEGKKKVDELLTDLSVHYFNNKHWADKAFQLAWAGGYFGNCAGCQNLLGIFFNNGIYVEQNYAAAAYWYRRAVQNGCAAATTDANGILNWYRENVERDETLAAFSYIVRSCAEGGEYIPKDPVGEKFWKMQIDALQ